MNTAFVHLRLHTEYSITDSIIRIGDITKKAAADCQPSLAITDRNNLFGALKFFSKARDQQLKPLIGCEIMLYDEKNQAQPYSAMILLCQNQAGYLKLCDWLTRAYHDQHLLPQKMVAVKKTWFAEGTEGLIALSGGYFGPLALPKKTQEAIASAQELARYFPNRFYLEIQRVQDIPASYDHVLRAVEIALETGLPLVATHPIQFLHPEDFEAHETRVCISEGEILSDQKRMRRFSADQSFLSTQTMSERFADLPSALANTLEIAKRCNFVFKTGEYALPQVTIPAESHAKNPDELMAFQAKMGLETRLAYLYPHPDERESVRATYEARLDFEIQTIVNMGFSSYFLIVADFIQWAKENEVPVGPGRGSGAGSLVAYSLQITDLDPLKYDLLFERFLNPERVSMPDFDIDFCMNRRDKVIEYVRKHYGEQAVSQIATFGSMAAKGVLRDVGRVLDMSYNFVDDVARLIPNELGITLKGALEKSAELKQRYDQEEEIKRLFELGFKLEGITRNLGMHAGGVLIAPGKIADFCPLYRAPDVAPHELEDMLSQFDKDDVEKVGLVKFDFLGLRTLTILDWAVSHIAEQTGKKIDLNLLPLNDKKTYDLLKQGLTTAVFQLESDGMKKLIRKLQPDCFEDIVALVALYRPGPLNSGMVDDFVDRKHGKKPIDYMHPKLEHILKPTYGVIVYQEQVMQIAQVLANYSLGAADLLRRAMGKKKPEEMAKQRSIFIEGAIQNGVDTALAANLFDLMEKFAEYGFNKSHSAAYALVAYQTAYLKAHYPAAFIAATISSEIADSEKINIFIQDAKAFGIKFLSPDINESDFYFTPVDEQTIRYGLGGIRNGGEAAYHSIAQARTEKKFSSFLDFCCRVRRAVNRRAMESLIVSGAFDSLNPNRAELIENLQIAIETAEKEAQHANQNNLFGSLLENQTDASMDIQHIFKSVPCWDKRTQLIEEKEVLGFCLSGHLYDASIEYYGPLIQTFLKNKVVSIQKIIAVQQELSWCAGIVATIEKRTIRNTKIIILQLLDQSNKIEVKVNPDEIDFDALHIEKDRLVFIEAKVSFDTYKDQYILKAKQIFTPEGLVKKYAKKLLISVNYMNYATCLTFLRQMLKRQEGRNESNIECHYEGHEARAVLKFPPHYTFEWHPENIAQLQQLFPLINYEVSY